MLVHLLLSASTQPDQLFSVLTLFNLSDMNMILTLWPVLDLVCQTWPIDVGNLRKTVVFHHRSDDNSFCLALQSAFVLSVSRAFHERHFRKWQFVIPFKVHAFVHYKFTIIKKPRVTYFAHPFTNASTAAEFVTPSFAFKLSDSKLPRHPKSSTEWWHLEDNEPLLC